MSRRWIPIVLVTVLATACTTWSMAGQGASRRGWSRNDTAVTPATVANLTGSWSAGVAGTAEPLGSSDAVLTTGSQVRGLDPGTGATKWTRSATTAAIRDANVFLASGGTTCTIRRVAVTTGVADETATFGGPSVVAPQGASSCGITGTLLDSDSVVVVPWYYSSTATTPSCTSAWSVSAGVTAFDNTLTPVWNRTVAASGCGTVPSDLLTRARFGGATRTTGHFVARYGDSLVALPVTCTGPCTPAWTIAVTRPVGTPISVSKTSLAIVDAGGTVRAYDEATGAAQWTGSVGTVAAAPLAATNARIFAIGGSTLYAFRAGGCAAAVCTPSWSAPIGHTADSRASIAGDVVYVGAGTSLVAFAAGGCGAATCTALTSKALGGTVTGPVAIVNGRVVVPTSSAVQTFVLPAT